MKRHTVLGILMGLAIALSNGGLSAQERQKGAFTYLQKEPMTLYDAGMKSLRRLTLDTASYFSAQSYLDATADVRFRPTLQVIDITLNIETTRTQDPVLLRKRCVELRRQALMKMFRVRLPIDTQDSLIVERIINRLGGQFAHEPIDKRQEFSTLGDVLATATNFTLRLSPAGSALSSPNTVVTCQGLVTELSKPTIRP